MDGIGWTVKLDMNFGDLHIVTYTIHNMVHTLPIPSPRSCPPLSDPPLKPDFRFPPLTAINLVTPPVLP